QLGVADAEVARGGIDALDPQRAEVALAHLARAVHVHPRVLDALVGDGVAVLPLAAEALRPLEHAVATAAGLESSFCAGHDVPLLRSAKTYAYGNNTSIWWWCAGGTYPALRSWRLRFLLRFVSRCRLNTR